MHIEGNAYSRMVSLIGPAGSGQLTKMMNQTCIAGAVHVGKQAGLDIEQGIEVISKGPPADGKPVHTMNTGKYDYGRLPEEAKLSEK